MTTKKIDRVGDHGCRDCEGSLDGLHRSRRYCLACRPLIHPGYRHGQRTILGRTDKTSRIEWRVRCDCGAEGIVTEWTMRKGHGLSCQSCSSLRSHANRKAGKPPPPPRKRPTASLKAGANGGPYDIQGGVRFEDDPEAIRFVHENPGGATLHEVAACFGLSRERVRQIEARALRNLRARLKLNPSVEEGFRAKQERVTTWDVILWGE